MENLEYLKFRKVKDKVLLHDIEKEVILDLAPLFVGGDEYEVYYIMSLMDEDGFDIEQINQNVGTGSGNIVTIGLVEGDDLLCVDTQDNSMYIKLIENGDGEMIKVANDYEDFKRCYNKK